MGPQWVRCPGLAHELPRSTSRLPGKSWNAMLCRGHVACFRTRRHLVAEFCDQRSPLSEHWRRCPLPFSPLLPLYCNLRRRKATLDSHPRNPTKNEHQWTWAEWISWEFWRLKLYLVRVSFTPLSGRLSPHLHRSCWWQLANDVGDPGKGSGDISLLKFEIETLKLVET